MAFRKINQRLKTFKHTRIKIGSQLLWIWRLPLTIGEFVILRLIPPEFHHGIACLDHSELSRPGFVEEMRTALDMLLSHDPLRFNRIIREIRYIFHAPCKSGSDYSRSFKICTVDLKNLGRGGSSQELTGLIGCVLIMAATLGHLERNGIIRSKSNYTRIEKLLRRECLRFSKRVGLELRDSIVEEAEAEEAPTFNERIRGTKAAIRKIWKDE